MQEPTRFEYVLGTLNQVCAGFLVASAVTGLYQLLFAMGWSDQPFYNTYQFNLNIFHPALVTMLWLIVVGSFLVGLVFLAAGAGLKYGLPWGDRACVIAALLLLVFVTAQLLYGVMVLHPARERALLASLGSIPEGYERGIQDRYALIYAVPLQVYGVALLVIMTMRRSS